MIAQKKAKKDRDILEDAFRKLEESYHGSLSDMVDFYDQNSDNNGLTDLSRDMSWTSQGMFSAKRNIKQYR